MATTHFVPTRPMPVTPRPWARMADAEWDALSQFMPERCVGRPLADERTRMDAIFWIARSGRPWKDLPPELGRGDTVARHFRRLAHRGLFQVLLKAIVHRRSQYALAGLAHWICRTYRRATRIIGTLRAIRLARFLGLDAALRGPAALMPNPDLSETYQRWLNTLLDEHRDTPSTMPIPLLNGLHRLLRFAAGRPRIPRWMEPA